MPTGALKSTSGSSTDPLAACGVKHEKIGPIIMNQLWRFERMQQAFSGMATRLARGIASIRSSVTWIVVMPGG